MKTKKFLYRFRGVFALIGIVTLLNSCDNSFLDSETPAYTETTDTIFVTNNSEPFDLNLDFNDNEACNWQLTQFPYWLDVYPKEGTKSANTGTTIHFAVKDADITVGTGFYSFPLVFDIDGKKMVGYTVVLANLGHPYINVSTTYVSFVNSLNSSFTITNDSYGILNWWITKAPDWLVAEEEYGLIDQNQNKEIKLSADINGLDPGEYSGTLEIQSNAENQKTITIRVTLKVGAHAYYGDYHEGQLIDTRYSKNRDEVIVLTKSPNQLLFFTSDPNNPVTVNLDRVPQCLALSENETTIAVGFSNSDITTYDAIGHSVIKTYNAGDIPVSVEFADNGYLYFIASISYWNYLHSLNLNTEEIIRQKNGESGMKTLKKVPGKQMLVSNRPGYSPDGLILFDISQTGQTDSMNLYHMDLNGYWISEDGERLFSGWKKIYNLPGYADDQDFFPYELTPTGQLDFESTQIVDCIADQNSSNRIFAATGFGWAGQNTLLNIYNGQTFVKQGSFELKFTRPDNFSVYNTWTGKPFAMFPSANKKDLWLVQKYAEYITDSPGIWSVSKVDITK